MLETSWIVAALYSAIITVCMALTAFLCLCGCKAKERRDELVGVEGHVKMTNPDVTEEVNGNGSVTGETAPTVKRSLPDLPVDNSATGNDVSWEPMGDTASELYATVGVQKTVKMNMAGVPTREHPYDKLKGVEHPYAQVLIDVASTSSCPPDGHSSPRPPAAPREIAAASAISGQIHASDDLPYMTPPTHFSGDSQDSAKGYTSISVREPLSAIRAETVEVHIEPRDQHYMTVSDDSDDMYAAIDEPASGSETYAQIQPAPVEESPISVDNYSQLKPAPPSVDSLRTSTTAPVLNHTHSRQESSSSATSTVNSPKPEKREANSPLPAPPGAASVGDERNLDDMYAKVNKKKRRDVEEVLERGPSIESAMSGSSESVSYRLHNNNISTADTSQSDSCHGQSTTCPSTSDPAPTGSSLSTTDSPSPPRAHATSNSSLSSDPDTRESYERLQDDPQYETLNKKIYETLNKKDAGYETINKNDPGYQTVESDKDPEYETLSDHHTDPCYATLNKANDPGYETVNQTDRLVSEPNYETLGRGPPSDNDPNYERIGKSNHDYGTLPGDGYATVSNDNQRSQDIPLYSHAGGDVYAAVVKQKHKKKSKDPPYATIASDADVDNCDVNGHLVPTEPPYASLLGEGFTSEPEYESVHYTKEIAEPPYQLLADFESGSANQRQ